MGEKLNGGLKTVVDVTPMAKPIGGKLIKLELAIESGDAESVLGRLSNPASVGLTDNMLSRTVLQISGFALPQGKPSPALMYIWFCCMAGFMEVRPEQACAIDRKMNTNATIQAVMIGKFLLIDGFSLLARKLSLNLCLSIHRS
jgi:hypothetical protein